jgi:hypothetical protein
VEGQEYLLASDLDSDNSIRCSLHNYQSLAYRRKKMLKEAS